MVNARSIYCKYINLMALQYGVFTVRRQTLEWEFFSCKALPCVYIKLYLVNIIVIIRVSIIVSVLLSTGLGRK